MTPLMKTWIADYSQKRKRTPVVLHQSLPEDTSKPSSVFQAPGKGRAGTLSIALPGSILANAPGLDLKTVLAGRIARAAAVFCVDEIIIFDDGQSEVTQDRAAGANGSSHHNSNNKRQKQDYDTGREQQFKHRRDPNALLELLLSYSECPPYLRKSLFEYNSDLGKSGLLPSLDVPHHLKADEWCQYREAVSIGPVLNNSQNGNSTSSQNNKKHTKQHTPETLVDAGFPVTVPAEIPPHTRLTIKFADANQPKTWPSANDHDYYYNNDANTNTNTHPQMTADAVDPAAPREEAGYYWGYTVRRASSLSAVFTESPFADGYDVSIGTSERGQSLLQKNASATEPFDERTNGEMMSLPAKAAHALLVVGGVAGLEVAVEFDAALADKGITRRNVGDLFDYYVNVCPGQGSRTIRTEEAIWIALGQLRSWVMSAL